MLQGPDHPKGRQGGVCLNSQRLTVEIIHDIKQPVLPAVRKTVAHKINAPHLVWLEGDTQRQLYTLRQPSSGPVTHVKLHGCINPVEAFMVPRISFMAQPVITLLEPYGRVPCYKFRECFFKQCVFFRTNLVMISSRRRRHIVPSTYRRWLRPSSRHTSLVEMPLSCFLIAATIWLSVNFDFFIVLRLKLVV